MYFDLLGQSYEKKVETVVVNNSTNINKTNSELLSQLIEHLKKTPHTLDIWC